MSADIFISVSLYTYAHYLQNIFRIISCGNKSFFLRIVIRKEKYNIWSLNLISIVISFVMSSKKNWPSVRFKPTLNQSSRASVHRTVTAHRTRQYGQLEQDQYADNIRLSIIFISSIKYNSNKNITFQLISDNIKRDRITLPSYPGAQVFLRHAIQRPLHTVNNNAHNPIIQMHHMGTFFHPASSHINIRIFARMYIFICVQMI